MEILGRKIGGKFAIESQLGGGAMGAVYRARQVDLDKEVAIKVLHDKHAQEASFVARFKREAKAASLIDHPNSMRVLDFGQEPDGLLYIAMELLEGPSLHKIIQTDGPLEAARIVNLTRQMLAALAAAHDLQILHRDLKPENIIVVTKRDDDGHGSELAKVCDFGIAKVGSSADSSIQTAKLTNAGSIVGTPDYMSPEQARGKSEVDARTDLYSMGVILYEMMTGRVPFKAETPLGVVLSHIHDEPRPPHELNPNVDPRLEAVCLKALSKSPNDRFSSAREMRAALADGTTAPLSLRHDSVRAPAPSDPSTSKRLVLAPDDSLATSDTMIAEAPVSEPIRPPTTSAMAALMADPIETPTTGPSPVVVVALLAMLVGGGGATYWLKFRQPAEVTGLAIATDSASASAAPPASASAPPSATPSAATSPSASALASGAPSFAPSSIPNGAHTPASSAGHATPAASGSTAEPAAASATASAPPPPAGPSRVVVGAITAEHATPSEIHAALPLAKFDLCYREGTLAKAVTGDARLHLTLTSTSTEARFEGSPELVGAVGDCVTRAAGSVSVSLPDGNATADVELSFR